MWVPGQSRPCPRSHLSRAPFSRPVRHAAPPLTPIPPPHQYIGEAGKALSGEEPGGALPWYAYAGAVLALGLISKLITDIASEALKEVNLEAAGEGSEDSF